MWAPNTPLATGVCWARAASYQHVEQSAPLLRRGCGREARSQAVPRIGRQGELRYQQKIPGDLGQIKVHLAGFVGKHAVFEQTPQKP